MNQTEFLEKRDKCNMSENIQTQNENPVTVLAITGVVISVIGFIFTIAITFSSVDRNRNELKLLMSKPILEMQKQK
jgi:hypothetical protein